MASIQNRGAARRHARAFFEAAVHEGDPARVERELSAFAGVLERHPVLRKTLRNPVFPVVRKQAVVEALAAQLGIGGISAKLLAILTSRGALLTLPDLLEAYRERLMDHAGVIRAEVTMAMPLPPDRLAAIEQGLSAATGKRVTMVTRVDPAIVGGVVTRIGSTVYDGSITRQLELIREKMLAGA